MELTFSEVQRAREILVAEMDGNRPLFDALQIFSRQMPAMKGLGSMRLRIQAVEEVHADLGFQHLGEHVLLLLGDAARKQMTTYDHLEP